MYKAKKRRVNKSFFYRELEQVKASVKVIIEDGLGAFYPNDRLSIFKIKRLDPLQSIKISKYYRNYNLFILR